MSDSFKSPYPQLDVDYPPCGPCMFCGHADKRHRVWDAFMGFADAGESAEQIGREYPDWPLEHIRLVLEIRPYREAEQELVR